VIKIPKKIRYSDAGQISIHSNKPKKSIKPGSKEYFLQHSEQGLKKIILAQQEMLSKTSNPEKADLLRQNINFIKEIIKEKNKKK
jgi:hypothetical protein